MQHGVGLCQPVCKYAVALHLSVRGGQGHGAQVYGGVGKAVIHGHVSGKLPLDGNGRGIGGVRIVLRCKHGAGPGLVGGYEHKAVALVDAVHPAAHRIPDIEPVPPFPRGFHGVFPCNVAVDPHGIVPCDILIMEGFVHAVASYVKAGLVIELVNVQIRGEHVHAFCPRPDTLVEEGGNDIAPRFSQGVKVAAEAVYVFTVRPCHAGNGKVVDLPL